MRTRHTLIALSAGALLTPAARAQFAVPWSTIDSGSGQLMTGGDYTLVGTVGQHDASAIDAPMLGGDLSVAGGFWHNPLLDPSCNDADLAAPYGVLDLLDITAFVSGFLAADPASDLAFPFGVFDLLDLLTFVEAFVTGCP